MDSYSRQAGSQLWLPVGFGGGYGYAVTPPVNRRQKLKGGLTLTPEQSQHQPNLTYARNFCHNLFVNSPVARSVGRVFRMGVIGPGIELRSEVRMRGRVKKGGVAKFNEKVNEQIQRDWQEWGRAVTVDGQLSWYETIRKALTTMLESGDCFIRFYNVKAENPSIGFRSKVPLSMQLLEGGMLDELHIGQVSGDDYWKDGIKYNKFGRPLAYGFKVIIRGEYETVEVDASEVLHLYQRDELRPNSRRGWPLLTSVIDAIDRMDAYFNSQLLHAEQNAAVTTYLIPPDYGTATAPLGDDEDPNADAVNIGNRAGGILPLSPGTDVKERTQQAQGQFDPYITASLQQVAAAVGVTYEALALDFSRANFSSSRLATIMNSERFGELRQFLIREFFEVVFKRWLSLMLLRPEYQKFSQDLDDYEHSWSHKRLPYVDPQKSLAAAKEAYTLGLASLETLSRDNGYDFESEMRKRAQNNEFLQELGIELEPPKPKNPNITTDDPNSDNDEGNQGEQEKRTEG